MYSGDVFNPHLLLRYGFTKDLFECFSSLKYLHVELPLLMVRPYHVLIREQVDQRLGNPLYIYMKQKQWNFYSMKDVQQKLQRIPPQILSLGRDSRRTTVLICGQFIDFALSQLSDKQVLILQSNPHDQKALQGKTLPENFHLFNLYETLRAYPLRRETNQWIQENISKFQNESFVKKHEIFSLPNFIPWLRSQLVHGIKLVEILTKLIYDHPIGIFLDHSELVYPGSILSLLGRLYGIPFINVQNHLTNDASIIPSRATHYCVWGSHMTQWLNKRGISKSNIYEIGSLRLANNERFIHKNRDDLLRSLEISENKFIIAFTTQCYFDSINHLIMEWMKKATEQLPLLVIINPHPSDRLSYERYISEGIRLTPSGYHLQEILQASDLIATISSTTALEGALLKKGMVILQPELPYDYHLNYNGYYQIMADGKGGISVHNVEELILELKKLMSDSRYYEENAEKGQHILHEMLTLGETKPQERLKNLLDELFFK